MGKNESSRRAIDLLLVESDSDTANRFLEAFKKLSYKTNIHIAATKEQALEVIHQRGDEPEAPPPDLILLSLDLPDEDSQDLLTTLKSDPKLRRPPVLAMFATDDEETVRHAYDLNANAYLRKPDQPDQFDKVATSVADFWFDTAHLPPKST